MLEKLIGDLTQPSAMETAYTWRFAMEHPYLHTFIKISDSFLYVVVAFGAYVVVKKIMKNKTQ